MARAKFLPRKEVFVPRELIEEVYNSDFDDSVRKGHVRNAEQKTSAIPLRNYETNYYMADKGIFVERGEQPIFSGKKISKLKLSTRPINKR